MLKVDGQAVATQQIPHTIAFLTVADETFDVGVDTRTSVNEKDGQIDRVTVNLVPPQLVEADQVRMRDAVARSGD